MTNTIPSGEQRWKPRIEVQKIATVNTILRYKMVRKDEDYNLVFRKIVMRKIQSKDVVGASRIQNSRWLNSPTAGPV